ncbi:PTS sugar transporter subunit IIA [Wansuia hejianensis]|uniref:PTS glucose transporter subunit IIA n=1 Tax=Wansuia hejianensis TaxID=2763667 RepID=A0A926IGH7_9FIRM|nr:PTS glucose transporter subunit IIA [Wansuia hejianensis]MBC8589602.1 PTS glucose transporter subunit IIA [Wansuia hejianensis]
MFKNLFKKKDVNSSNDRKVDIFSPIKGEVITLENVPDEVFSGKMLGDGFAVKPVGNQVYSPVSGEVKVLFPTLHAVAIQTPEGLEVLVHIGVDTVELNGEGFTGHVKVGDKVKQGDLLVSFNKETIEQKAKSSITPVIITNMDAVMEISIDYGDKEANEKAGTIKLK